MNTSNCEVTQQSEKIAVAEDPAHRPRGEVFGFEAKPDREDHPKKRDGRSVHNLQNGCLILISQTMMKFIEKFIF